MEVFSVRARKLNLFYKKFMLQSKWEIFNVSFVIKTLKVLKTLRIYLNIMYKNITRIDCPDKSV